MRKKGNKNFAPYKRNMHSNKVKYGTATGTYCTTRDLNVPCCIPYFYSSNIIPHCFHIDNDEGKSVIGYDMIIGRDLMVKLFVLADFNHQVLQWYGIPALMKEPRGMIGQIDLNICKMREVVMQTAESVLTRESTERLVKILKCVYAKENFIQVAYNTTQLKSE